MKTYETAMGRGVERIDRRNVFRIGGKIFKTIVYKRVPVKVRSHQEYIEVGVIEVEIPLAISKLKLREWGGTIYFEENVLYLRIIKEDVKLKEIATGHLGVSLARNIEDDKEETVKELF